MSDLEIAKELVREAVFAKLRDCGNSYINAYTQRWLERAKAIGCYSGPLTGTITEAILSLSDDEAVTPEVTP